MGFYRYSIQKCAHDTSLGRVACLLFLFPGTRFQCRSAILSARRLHVSSHVGSIYETWDFSEAAGNVQSSSTSEV